MNKYWLAISSLALASLCMAGMSANAQQTAGADDIPAAEPTQPADR